MAEEYPQVSKWATIFLYPFPFPAKNKDALCLTLQRAADRWEQYTLSQEKHGTELSYFFPYTRKFLCSQIAHFTFRLPEGSALRVSTYNELALTLVTVRLHLFPLGIGILSLHVEGTPILPFEKLLDFNSDFRYLRTAYKRQPSLPQIALEIGSERIPKATHSEPGLYPLINDFLWEIGGVPPSQLLDDRAIVYAYAALKRDSLPGNYDLDAPFFKFLFVDHFGEALPDADFRKELLTKYEYKRWQNYTYNGVSQSVRFGFSRYSGVVMGIESVSAIDPPQSPQPLPQKVSPDDAEEKDFFKDTIFRHFRTMYYDMALILLFHRTALLKLSDDLSRVDIETSGSQERRDRVRQLRAQVLEFTNRYWFGEITNQDQGIEMFDCWKSALRNSELFEEVHRELQEYDNELRNLNAEWLNSIVTAIVVLTFLFLPLSFTISFLTVSDFTWGSFYYYALRFYPLFAFLGALWYFGKPLLKLAQTLWTRFKASLPEELK